MKGLDRDENVAGISQKVLSGRFRSMTESKHRVALLSPPHPPQETFSSLQFARELAQRDLQTIQRQLARLEMDFTQLQDSSKRIRNAFQEYSKQLYGAAHACNVMASIEEKHGGSESIAWKELNGAMTTVAPHQHACATSLNCNVVELATIFSLSFLSSRTNIDAAKISLSAPGADESEKFEIATGVAKEWDTSRRIRASLMLDQFGKMCTDLALAHSNIADRWEMSRNIFESFDPSDETIKLESDKLRKLLNDEMGDLGSTLNSLQDSFVEKQGMQQEFLKISNALRNGSGFKIVDPVRDSAAHNAILKRPVLPPGSRKEPTPVDLNPEIRRRLSSDILDEEEVFSRAEKYDDPVKGTSGSWDCDDDGEVMKGRRSLGGSNFFAEDTSDEYGIPPPPPPKKASFGWSDLFVRGFSGIAHVSSVVHSSRGASVIDDNEEQQGEEEHEEDETETSRESFAARGSAGGAFAYGDDQERVEDTPMNRAYKQREVEWAKKREQEERQHRNWAEDGSADGIYERRRAPRAVLHSTGPAQRRAKAKQPGTTEAGDIYVPSPKPAPSLRPFQGHSGETTSVYFEHVPFLSELAGPRNVQQPTRPHQSQHKEEQSNCQPQPQPQPQPQSKQPEQQKDIHFDDLPAISSSTPTMRSNYQGHEPLPDGWEAVATADGSVYYYHRISRVSRWDFPSRQVQAALEERLKESQKQQQEAVQKRKIERDNIRRAQEEQAQAAQNMQSQVKKVIFDWRYPSGPGKPRPFYDLLNTLHTVVIGIVASGEVVKSPLSEKSKPAEVKRAYFAAAKCLHPDKLTSDIPIEQRIVAEAAFVVLSECWEVERSKAPVNI